MPSFADDPAPEEHAADHVGEEEPPLGDLFHEQGPRSVGIIDQYERADGHPPHGEGD